MYEACVDSSWSLQDWFLLSPVWSAIVLLVLGAASWALWSRLKGRRRLFLLPVVAGFSWAILAEPAELWQKKRAAALELAQTPASWQANAAFELRNSAQKVSAFRTKLGSKCNSGFLVTTHSMNVRDFTETVPNSPGAYRREGVFSLVSGTNRFCFYRAEVMWGDRRKEHPDACSKLVPRLIFFSTRRDDPHGFEMLWCTSLNSQFAYCEADGHDVALASGMRF